MTVDARNPKITLGNQDPYDPYKVLTYDCAFSLCFFIEKNKMQQKKLHRKYSKWGEKLTDPNLANQ